MIPPPPISTLFPYTTLFRSLYYLRWLLKTIENENQKESCRICFAQMFDCCCFHLFCFVLDQQQKQTIKLLFKHEKKLQRSEEHTSELQSRENLVCRLLLEKK